MCARLNAVVGGFSLTILVAQSLSSCCWAQPAEPAAKPPGLRQTLMEPTTLEFVGAPLSDVSDYLQDRHSVKIHVDRPAIELASLLADPPVTLHVRGMSLRSALAWMVDQLGLVGVAKQDEIVITTAAGAKKQGGTLLSKISYKPGDKVVVKGREFEPAAAEAKIMTALKSPTALEFVETPLPDVIEYLHDLHGIPILIDSRAIQAAGRRADKPITRLLKDITLQSALRLLLHDSDLVCVVQQEYLEITTDAGAKKHGGTLLSAIKFNLGATIKAEEKIKAALKSPTDLDFVQAPLVDVVEYLRVLHKIEIQIDTQGLAAMNMGTDTPITIHVKNVSFDGALRMMLKSKNLKHTVQDGVLLITPAGR